MLYKPGFVFSRFRVFVVSAAVASSVSCAPRLMKLPSGPGVAATDAREAIGDATARCHAVTSLTAELAVSGSVGGQRLRGHLLAGVAEPASARIEAVAPAGPPLFIFVAMKDDATLVLPRDDRVLQHGRPADVLDAVAGVPLDATDLRMVLTGCAQAPDADQARQFGADWRVVRDGPTDVYLRRDGSKWRVVATVRRGTPVRVKTDTTDVSRVRLQPDLVGWRAEYGDFADDLPRSVHLASADGHQFNLLLKLSQVETNVALGADAFTVKIPPDADPITLDELRRSRPGVREN